MTIDDSQPCIVVKGAARRFSRRSVLRNLDFQAFPGEFVALLGANGAGKTTFLRMLATLTRPSAGEISLGGRRLPAEASAARGLVGMVSHHPLLYGELTAVENLLFYARLYGLSSPQARIDELLSLTGLEAYRSARVRTFSLGMQQRLAIARAALHDPLILLLDEPYTALDQSACDALDALLKGGTARHRTVVMATHDFEHAVGLATRFDVLHGGRIAASCPAPLSAPELRQFYQESLRS